MLKSSKYVVCQLYSLYFTVHLYTQKNFADRSLPDPTSLLSLLLSITIVGSPLKFFVSF